MSAAVIWFPERFSRQNPKLNGMRTRGALPIIVAVYSADGSQSFVSSQCRDHRFGITNRECATPNSQNLGQRGQCAEFQRLQGMRCRLCGLPNQATQDKNNVVLDSKRGPVSQADVPLLATAIKLSRRGAR
jgi:hypothetical protein